LGNINWYNYPDFNTEVADFDLTGTVKVTGTPPVGANYSPPAGNAVANNPWIGGCTEVSADGSAAYTVDEESNDTETGYMIYVGGGSIPSSQSFLVTTYLGGEVGFNPRPTLTPSYASASATDLTFGGGVGQQGNALQDLLGLINTPGDSINHYLVTKTPDPKNGVVTFSVSAKLSAVVDSNGDGSGPNAYASEYFTVVPDTRSVSIGSGTIARRPVPNSFDKYNNQQYAKGPELVDPDGTTHGDTTFSGYINVPTGGVNPVDGSPITMPQAVPNWQYFTPTYSGNWIPWGSPTTPTVYDPNDPTGDETRTIGKPAVTWAWGPDESDDWEMYGKCSMPEDPYMPSDGPAVPYNVSYSVTSLGSNPATATAKCDLMVHQTEEVKAINSPTDTTDPNYYSTKTYPAVLIGSAAQPGGSETYSYAPGVALYGSFSGDGTALQAISAALFEIPEASAVLNLAGFLANSVNDNTSTTGTATYLGVWPTGNPADINVWSGREPDGWVPGMSYLNLPSPKEAQFCTFTVKEVVYYKNTLYSCDTWGQGGYAGYSEDFVGTNAGTGQPQANWTYNPTP